jgi:SulP family sulfate permease
MSPTTAPTSALQRWLPIAGWLPKLGKAELRGDLTAGLTTAVMLIPQGMAYAMLAGLPPIIGLYASVVPLVLYAIFGSSRQLAVGPVAMVSLLVAGAVAPLADGDAALYLSLAVLLALMVGVIQLAMGVLRMGFLTNFLSHPVLSGFTSAAALIIGFSQLKHLMGVAIPRSHHVHEILLQAVEKAPDMNLPTVVIGVVSVVVLVALKKAAPAFPRALAVVVGSTLAVWGLGLHEAGVSIVGEVPAGLPSPALPTIDMAAARELLPTALTISLVAFMESIAVAQAFAKRHKYTVQPNQELVGLGIANLGAAAFGGYPVTGGFSRTAVNDQAGAKTPLAGIITAVVIALALLFLTPLLHFVPKAVLAAIIMTAVFGLIDIKEVRHLWHVDRTDLAFLAITFAATLSLGIEQGILLGAASSLVVFIYRTTTPHLAVLGRLPGTTVYRNISRFDDAITTPGVLAVRVDSEFYFGNTRFLRESLARLEQERFTGDNDPLQAVVIDAATVTRIDSSALTALEELHADLKERGIGLYLAGIRGPVRDAMQRAHLIEKLGEDHLPLRVHHVFRDLLPDGLDEPETAEVSPLAGVA